MESLPSSRLVSSAISSFSPKGTFWNGNGLDWLESLVKNVCVSPASSLVIEEERPTAFVAAVMSSPCDVLQSVDSSQTLYFHVPLSL